VKSQRSIGKDLYDPAILGIERSISFYLSDVPYPVFLFYAKMAQDVDEQLKGQPV
jgi:hypothetical protein